MSSDFYGDHDTSAQPEAPTSPVEMNGSQKPTVVDSALDDSDVRSVSSDVDNERVREKLKKTTIAPAPSSRSSSWAKLSDEQGDDLMDSANHTAQDGGRRIRKRSHDESDEDKLGEEDGKQRRRHERKRSREISEDDRIKPGSGLERIKTPPTHLEENSAIAEKVSSPRGLERKRSLGKLDKEEDADQKKKITKTKEERGQSQEHGTGVNEAEINVGNDQKEANRETKLPQSSGFSNSSTKSPFATAVSGTNIFGSVNNSSTHFANSKFGALSGSTASPFGTLGSTSGSQSPFGALGSKSPLSGFGSAFGTSATGGSVFGGNTFGSGTAFGSTTGKSSQPKKPFGAPDEDDKSDEDEEGSDDDYDEKNDKESKVEENSAKPLFLKEQEVMTGEEDETTIFKCGAKVFTYNKEEKAWKERGRGTLKLNRTAPMAVDFGLTPKAEGIDTKPKQSARLILRTDRTFVVVLNCPIYKGMKMGDEPTGNQLSFLAVETTGPVPIVLRVGKLETARELHKYIIEL